VIIRRFKIYFSLTVALAVGTTLFFEFYSLNRAAESSVLSHKLFVATVAHFVEDFIASECKHLDSFLKVLPLDVTKKDEVLSALDELRKVNVYGKEVTVFDSNQSQRTRTTHFPSMIRWWKARMASPPQRRIASGGSMERSRASWPGFSRCVTSARRAWSSRIARWIH